MTKTSGKKIIKFRPSKRLKRKICYVLQGGGALGAYQVGAYQAFREFGYSADMIIGISIGGINAAIIAGNPVEKRVEKLHKFWDLITFDVPVPMFPEYKLHKVHNWFGAHMALNGNPAFYKSRLINPAFLTKAVPEQLSYYDTSPLRETLSELIDFKYLNEKKTRLCLGSVELSSGEFVFFDSFEEEITLDHVLATGALPPAFPPVKIGNKYYIDGGVFSNTPIFKLIDEFADHPDEMENILCFMIDLFSASGPYPHSMDGMLERVKDIQYSSHSKRPTALVATTQNLSHAINYLSGLLTEEQLKIPEVQEIAKLGLAHRVDVVRLIYRSPRGTELESKDYNFSREAALIHHNMGYDAAKQLVIEQQHRWESASQNGINIYSPDNNIVASIPCS
ncbi:MAG: patatin-like phospholipase family protein [Burkholderiales bacterium]|nr:patatin-like phospholipase family protein [Burkholderiales bacterium]